VAGSLRLVTALVLAAVPVAACREEAPVVVGSATYQESVILPKDAAFAAALLDVPPGGEPMSVVAMTVTRAPAAPPIAFRIPFDRKKIDPTHRYLIRGQLTSGGKVLFGTDLPYVMPSHGSGPPVELRLGRL